MTDEEWKQFIRSLWRFTDDKTMEELEDIERKYFQKKATDEEIIEEIVETVDRGLRRQFQGKFTNEFIDFLRKEWKL